MVVLKPMFKDEVLRTCTLCGHLGLGSPIEERRSFYRRNGSTYRSECCTCGDRATRKWREENHERELRARSAARRRRRAKMTPEQRDEQRRRDREYYHQRKNDPVYIQSRHAANARYRERNREKLRDLRQIDRLLKKEREGTWKAPELKLGGAVPKSGVHLPIEPPRNWLNELIANRKYLLIQEGANPVTAEKTAISRVVEDLKTSSRRVYEWRFEATHMDSMTIDRLASRHGGITVDQIYRHYGDGYSILIADDFTYLRVDYWNPNE